MKFSSPRAWLAATALCAVGTLSWAQIERLDLSSMVAKTDQAVDGTITQRQVFRVDSPIDGPELYFTTLTIQGTSLYTGQALTIDVTFSGGFVTPTQGAYNSEAPSAADTKVGNHVVVFSRWSNNMGGDVAANAIYAAHGGLYNVIDTRNGQIVQGRGAGYAIDKNVKTADLRTSVSSLKK